METLKTKIENKVKKSEPNLVVLTKWGKGYSANPVEQRVLCNEHYNMKKRTLNDYKIRRAVSCIPEIWCEVCTPPDFGCYN